MKNIEFVKSSGNLFKDIGFNEVEASSLKFRSRLMSMLLHYIQREGLTQKEAAEHFRVTQTCMNNLVHGKIDSFNEEMLNDMMARTDF